MKYNIKLIDDYLKKNNLTKKEFCKRCNFSEYILNNFYKGKSIRLSHIFSVLVEIKCRAFDLLGF